MQVHFVKLSPTQNMTLLITEPMSRADYGACASALMRYESVHAEQTGFVEQASSKEAAARLQMMGGEFCGNATMALAVLVARNRGLSVGQTCSLWLESPGTGELIACSVTHRGAYFVGEIEPPIPSSMDACEIEHKGMRIPFYKIDLPGITHLLVTASLSAAVKSELVERILTEKEPYSRQDALGILFLDTTTMEMVPVVAVRSIGSLVWERGCGSGSAAAGYALSLLHQKSGDFSFKQPGGILRVRSLFEEGRVRQLRVQGEVRIVAEGVAYYP